MKRFLPLLLYLITLNFNLFASPKGCHVFGKVKFVEFGQDYKVKFVTFGADLKVKYVSFGANTQGQWSVVDFGQNFKIKIVDFGQDFTVQMVDFGEGCGTVGGSIPNPSNTYVPGQYVLPFIDDFLTNQLPALANKMAEEEANRADELSREKVRKELEIIENMTKNNSFDFNRRYEYQLVKIFDNTSCMLNNLGSANIYDVGDKISSFKIIKINFDSIVIKKGNKTITMKVGETKNLNIGDTNNSNVITPRHPKPLKKKNKKNMDFGNDYLKKNILAYQKKKRKIDLLDIKKVATTKWELRRSVILYKYFDGTDNDLGKIQEGSFVTVYAIYRKGRQFVKYGDEYGYASAERLNSPERFKKRGR